MLACLLASISKLFAFDAVGYAIVSIPILALACAQGNFPALPVWMISPVLGSSARRTGQPCPSIFASTSSSFVPRILNVDFAGSMDPNKGTVAV